ncbi:MAG: MCE family protein [Mycobacterium sp.]
MSKRLVIQLAVFAIISVVAGAIMIGDYIKIPAMFGVGRYTVAMELPVSGGLYRSANVTYRGTTVGKVESVGLAAGGGVRAVLSLKSGIAIPSNLEAEVHSASAIGEQYVALLPRDGDSAPLRNGDTIARANTSVPPPIDALLDASNRGLLAIPKDNLKTVVDESSTAFGGLGPELSRIVKGASQLAIDARANLGSLTSLIDSSAAVLNSQADSADSIRAWAAHLATVSGQLRDRDAAVNGLIANGSPTTEKARQLIERLQPTLPIILANLGSVGQVLVDYHAGLEQLLVLLPQGVANIQAGSVANLHSRNDNPGGYLSFNVNLNLPPPCTTGFLPAQQHRTAVATDYPERPNGLLYCRVPQDSPYNVRGARNLPCLTRPGKRAPTVQMCESDEQYVPLNDGYNWKGDPNATNSGQSVPQPVSSPRPAAAAPAPVAPAPPPLAVVKYDQTTGTYVGPDGRVYSQTDLAKSGSQEKTWQDMLSPEAPN